MNANDLYRKLTKDGAVYVKMGEVVVKDADAVLEKIHEVLPETWPTRQKLVFFVLAFVKENHLDVVQAMNFWIDLDKAARKNLDV